MSARPFTAWLGLQGRPDAWQRIESYATEAKAVDVAKAALADTLTIFRCRVTGPGVCRVFEIREDTLLHEVTEQEAAADCSPS